MDKLERLFDGEKPISAPNDETSTYQPATTVATDTPSPLHSKPATNLTPRINNGSGWFIFSQLSLGLGLIIVLMAIIDIYLMPALWAWYIVFFLAGLSGTSASIGLILLIAHKIELRMIDIQKALLKG